MKDPPSPGPSRLRQQIRSIESDLGHCIHAIVDERGPLIRGTFVRQKRRCGKPACRCARGHPHEGAVLTASVEGRMHSVHVPRADRARVEKLAGRYRRFRQGRADLVALHRRLLQHVDALQQALTEPYPHPRQQRGKATPRRGER